eukprot:gene9138-16261_t
MKIIPKLLNQEEPAAAAARGNVSSESDNPSQIRLCCPNIRNILSTGTAPHIRHPRQIDPYPCTLVPSPTITMSADTAEQQQMNEEAKQRSFAQILEKANDEYNQADAIALRDEIMMVGICDAQTVKGLVNNIFARVFELLDKEEKSIDFRLLIVKKCKEELEAAKSNVKEKPHHLHRVVLFIAHLYKNGLANDKTVHTVIQMLMKSDDLQETELLCDFLPLVGEKLEASNRGSSDDTVPEYFASVEKLKGTAESQSVAARLQEVLDLRSKGWVQ